MHRKRSMPLVILLALAAAMLGSAMGAAVLARAVRPAIANAARQSPNSATAPQKSVVVELFTSEGCSSCPPMDALLKKLDAEQLVPGADVIGIEEHVDYWNHDGWVDPYSSPQWTARQQDYVWRLHGQTPYTPEVIIQGETEFTGNAEQLGEAITKAAGEPQPEISITLESRCGADAIFDVHVNGMPNVRLPEKADVWLGVTEDGLQSNVTGGENKGRMLQHAAVLRSLQKIGGVSPKETAPFSARRAIGLTGHGWVRRNLRAVAFVEGRKTGRIYGAAAAQLGPIVECDGQSK